ncbi:uncharacterized protein TNIN_150351 [Trichonephila inaurata madagascariensis]|uniref:Uncharacterized protein n=1 Tax=Trichonephila inaurata madagascariensis TaxID=2747483 RepID=A0A8X6X724_9ARAC|nr:uncharacterized protein TNIN_150351 [Trichonephila inaurata madagascariensis]
MGFGDISFWSLHVFCNVSLHAYTTVIFLRCETNEKNLINFVAARLRVALLKGITIPDLELMATDSTAAISWMRSNDAWGTFVGNRVKEIYAFSRADQWSYVPSLSNPADLLSRGSPLQFSKSDRWSAPDWLKDPGDR